MVISVSVNEVIRAVLDKFQSVYEKYYDLEVVSPVTTPNLLSHVHFETDDELLDFLYSEASMEVFGHAKETSNNVISHLVELYKSMPSDYKLRIVSDDLGKAKPATLWFLSKYGCSMDELIFYTTETIDYVWDTTDIFITSDMDVISAKPENKKLVTVSKEYNTNTVSNLTINSIMEIESFKNLFND
jgi:hypothetical protein|tara:strand:- start:62 stop:622 length:561 start_codon:yes stop_codon:yes gene_type:complete